MAAAHPTERLAKEIMTPEPVCIELGMSIRDVARIFDENEISGAPVVDEEGRLVGVVSRTDLVRRYASGDVDPDPKMLIELFATEDDEDESGPMPEGLVAVTDFMTRGPVTATPSTTLHTVAKRMVDARVHRVIVVDQGRFPVGIITSLDLVKALASL
ncbi:MAG: CBS domain-containing protein [Phycisphaerales bacterium]